MARKLVSDVGKKYHRLLVLSSFMRKRKRFGLCRCECGTEKVMNLFAVRSGRAKSCGCFQIESARLSHLKHGHSPGSRWRTPEYNSWMSMLARCNRKTFISYPNYGARGIKVCERWRTSFQNFFNDMGPRPAGLSLERKNNHGDYCPENCEWASARKQSRNRRTNRMLILGTKTQCLQDWAEEFNISPVTLAARIGRMGWSLDKALNQAIRKKSA